MAYLNKVSPNLQGKTVVITGASSGVGRAAALAFARAGATLILAARGEAPLAQIAEECSQIGSKAVAKQTDVGDAKAMKQLALAAFELSGKIDIWVNNAGVLAAGDFSETPIEVHEQVIRTNLLGYVNGAHAVLPYFKNQQHGILINNISVGGWMPIPYGVGYSASKFGLKGFSEALRGELIRFPHIHVCNLFPAFLDTPGIQHAGNYTGRILRPSPPVYDPQRVASAMVKIAASPKSSVTVGSVAQFLRLAHLLFPKLSMFITAKFIEGYLKQADPGTITTGNLFGPVEYGTSIHGGWNTQEDARQRRITGAVFITGVLAGFLLAIRK